ncbi:thioredoxin domain-containing protein [Novosphingobium lindaniclasticum]|uniref:hypothetical protein n=1 Tax=Novosphingobium lindaniclasticum TaxID=1329895 RepID=UPI000420F577|nr:hypothetical protein [Novosphingobium lindaniclasticum]
MTITITAFENAPDRGRGLARDMRVRWALEELGLPYATRLLSFDALKAPDHLAYTPSARYRASSRTGWFFSSRAPSCFISPGTIPASCRFRVMRGPVQWPGSSPP